MKNYPRKRRLVRTPEPTTTPERHGRERYVDTWPRGGFTTRDLVILTPMLGRAHRVAPVVESALRATPHARIMFVVSPEDEPVLAAIADVLRLGEPGVDALLTDWPGGTPGDYARKMNMGVARTSEALIFLGADDLDYHPGWFVEAVNLMRPGIGVVGTNDLGNPRVMSGAHSTHSLIRRGYIEQCGTIDTPGQLLHEGYVHEFCDDELVQTARFRRAYAHAHKAHVEHLHPHWGKGEMDASYAAQTARMDASRAHFQARQRMWGGGPR